MVISSEVFDPFKVRLVPVRFNGSPGLRGLSDDSHPESIAPPRFIFSALENGQITEINDFLTFDGKLFSKFDSTAHGLTDEFDRVFPVLLIEDRRTNSIKFKKEKP